MAGTASCAPMTSFLLTLLVCCTVAKGQIENDALASIGQTVEPNGVSKLELLERCNRLPVFPAPCTPADASPTTQSWFYDALSVTCRQLPFTGCRSVGDSENSFETLEKCQQICLGSKEQTKEPMKEETTASTFQSTTEAYQGQGETNRPAVHTISIVIPVRQYDEKEDGQLTSRGQRSQGRRSGDRQSTSKSPLRKPLRQGQQRTVFRMDDRRQADGQQRRPTSTRRESWSVFPLSRRQAYSPGLLAIAARLRVLPAELGPQRAPQQQTRRRQTVSRKPEAFVNEDVMMTSILYGLVGSRPQRRVDGNFLSSSSGFSVTDLPINRFNQRPSDRFARMEENEERTHSNWKRQGSSMEKPFYGSLRRRVILGESRPRQIPIRNDQSFGLGGRRQGTQYSRLWTGPFATRSMRSKSQSRKILSSQSTEMEARRRREELARFGLPHVERYDARRREESRGVPSYGSDRQQQQQQQLMDGKLALFQVVVRRQQDFAPRGYIQPMQSPDDMYFPVMTNYRQSDTNDARQRQSLPFFYDTTSFIERSVNVPRPVMESGSEQVTPASQESQSDQKENDDQKESDDSTTQVVVVSGDVDDSLVQPSYVCFLPLDVGNCKSYENKWYFNLKAGRCEMFFYGTCGGNANRFDDIESCQRTCTPLDVTAAREGQTPNSTDDVIEKSDGDQSSDETTTPPDDDVIIMTSPVYVPMTREDFDAETQTESNPAVVRHDVTEGWKVESQGHSSTGSEVGEQSATRQHHIASLVDQSAITAFSKQYIAVVSVLGAVGLAVITMVVLTVIYMCRKVQKSKKEAAIEDVIKSHMYGDLPQVIYAQSTLSDKFNEKL